MLINVQLLNSQQYKSLIRAKERKVLYIFSFLTFFVTFLCQDKKVNNRIAFVQRMCGQTLVFYKMITKNK